MRSGRNWNGTVTIDGLTINVLSYDNPLLPGLAHPGPDVQSVSKRMEREGA